MDGDSRIRSFTWWRRGRAGRRSGLALAAVALAIGGLAPLASSTPATDGNPDLPPTCGLDVTLVLDDSGSIDSSEADQVRSAAATFASALVGTPSTLKVVVFSSRATGINAAGGSTSNLGNVVFRDPALYSAPTSGAGSGGTNWDDALEVVRRSDGGPGDLVVLVTDGDPTYRNEDEPDGHANDGSHDLDGDGSTIGDASNLSAAVYEADAIKDGGAHMFGIGVGLNAAPSEQRLNDVTGDEELTLDGLGNPNISFGEADYAIAPNFNFLQGIVDAFVRDLCAPSVNVTKHLQHADGTTTQAGAGDPWSFTATVSPTPLDWQSPVGASGTSASQATDASGGVSFKWSMDVSSATVDLTEAPQAGWVYNGARCTRNLLDGSDPTVIFDSVGTNAPAQSADLAELQDLTVGLEQAVNCDVYNRELRTSTIQVAKQTVPAGLADTFDFTLQQGPTTLDSIDDLAHGGTGTFDPVPPGSYEVVEAAAPGYTTTSATCDDLGTVADEQVPASQLAVRESQNWRCTFVNTAANGSITIVKQAQGADGSFSFTSDLPGGDFGLTTVGGTASTGAISVVPGTYHVAESSPAPWQQTGATCTGTQSPSSIVVGPDQDIVCTFTNVAPDPTIVVTKAAGVPSVAEPSGSVTYTVTIANTSVEPVTITTITDSIEGGPALDLTAVAAPITATDCDDLIGDVLTASGVGSTASCTFTATVSGTSGDVVDDTVTVTALDSSQTPAVDSDDESVAVTDVRPTLTVTKTPAPSTVPETGPGGTQPVQYTVTIQNTSPEPVTIDSIVDSVEGGPASAVGGTCAALVGTTLAPAAGTSCTFTGNVAGDAGDTVEDVVTVTVSDDDGNSVPADDDATVTFTGFPSSISVTKTASVGSVPEPGGPVTYTIDIANTSVADSVTIDSITDSVSGGPAQAAGGTCPALIGTVLAPGASTSCSFTLTVSGNAGDSVPDAVVVGGTDDDDGPVEGSAFESVDVTDVPSSISVTKTPSVGSVPEPGGPVTYTVVITNTSAADAVTIGGITDSVSGGPASAAGGTCPALVGTVLAPGASASCTFTTTVSGNAGDAVPDTVVVSGTDDDAGPVSASASASVDVTDVGSSLQVTKTPSVGSVPEPGGPVTYTVQITNTSDADAITIDAITDAVSGGPAGAAGGTCDALVGTQLAPGASTSCTFSRTVAGDAGDSVPDTVVVTGTDDDDEPVEASGGAIVDVTDVLPSGTVSKDAEPSTVGEPGGPVVFSVTVTNTSATEPATVTAITDTVDGMPVDVTAVGDPVVATTCATGASVPPGGTYTCSFTLQVAGSPGDVVDDVVSASLSDDDGNTVTPTDTETVTVTDVLPSITVSKSNGAASVPAPGDEVTFDVVVTNTSPVDPVTLTSLTDTVEGGTPFDITVVAPPVVATTCATGGTIPVGGTYSCSFTLVVASDEATTEADTVDAVAVDDEGNQASAGDGAVSTVTASADLAIDKRLPGDVLEAGERATYELVVTNQGPSTATGVTVVDTVPDGLRAVSASGDGWDCAVDGQAVTCTRVTLGAGETTTITLVVDVADAAAGDTVTNVATVDADTDDPDDANNRDEVSTQIPLVVPTQVEQTTTTTATLPEQVDQGTLPRTGTEPGGAVVVAVAMLGAGTVLLLARRRSVHRH